MAKQPTRSEKLPEPSHPFARWGDIAAVSICALGAQSLPDPWNRVGAILSPGIGYIVGMVLDVISRRISDASHKSGQRRSLSENEEKIKYLYKQREDAVSYGANTKHIASIDTAIAEIRQTNIRIITETTKT